MRFNKLNIKMDKSLRELLSEAEVLGSEINSKFEFNQIQSIKTKFVELDNMTVILKETLGRINKINEEAKNVVQSKNANSSIIFSFNKRVMLSFTCF